MRESGLIAQCTKLMESSTGFSDIRLMSENLPIGDIVVGTQNADGEFAEHVIIERKSVADLAASIRDGRYVEQSYRLDGSPYHNHNIIYLVEGDLYKHKSRFNNMDRQSLYSSLFSIQYFKGFSVMRSCSVEESAFIICNMCKKLSKSLKTRPPYYLNASPALEGGDEDHAEVQTTSKQYCHVIKKVKKDNITPSNIGEIMLAQIPNVSAAIAVAVMKKFNTLPELIQAIFSDATCMNDVRTTDKQNKSRKISKRAIENITLFLASPHLANEPV
jgi:ERCC4-type nuclease